MRSMLLIETIVFEVAFFLIFWQNKTLCTAWELQGGWLEDVELNLVQKYLSVKTGNIQKQASLL